MENMRVKINGGQIYVRISHSNQSFKSREEMGERQCLKSLWLRIGERTTNLKQEKKKSHLNLF